MQQVGIIIFATPQLCSSMTDFVWFLKSPTDPASRGSVGLLTSEGLKLREGRELTSEMHLLCARD